MGLFFTSKTKKVTANKNINWKPNNVGIIVPKQNRPSYNKFVSNGTNDVSDFKSKFGTARPQKHYRKQLVSYFNTKSSHRVSIDDINGSSRTNVKYTLEDEYLDFFNPCTDDKKNNVNYIYQYILDRPKVCLGEKILGKCKGGNTNVYYSRYNSKLNNDYYETSENYLKNKCKTYNQKITLSKKTSNDDNSYNMTSCYNNKCNKTIYKPNNKKFAKQGSVESSTRLLRLKYDTITKNGSSFTSAYGREAANAGKYKNSISGNTIYFNKDKTNLNTCLDFPLNFRKPDNLKTKNC
tara:strand:- start:3550 stop:4431 length:882 start_codon:yes stop_codon:yes gene_type:complete